MARTRAADDFDFIRARRDELRKERGLIEIAGPAGNPTQPTGECAHDWKHIQGAQYRCEKCQISKEFYSDVC